MNPEFLVTVGLKAFKIVDHYSVVCGSYESREDADHYCEILNEKWERDTQKGNGHHEP